MFPVHSVLSLILKYPFEAGAEIRWSALGEGWLGALGVF